MIFVRFSNGRPFCYQSKPGPKKCLENGHSRIGRSNFRSFTVVMKVTCKHTNDWQGNKNLLVFELVSIKLRLKKIVGWLQWWIWWVGESKTCFFMGLLSTVQKFVLHIFMALEFKCYDRWLDFLGFRMARHSWALSITLAQPGRRTLSQLD
jgi:hypothetical protein